MKKIIFACLAACAVIGFAAWAAQPKDQPLAVRGDLTGSGYGSLLLYDTTNGDYSVLAMDSYLIQSQTVITGDVAPAKAEAVSDLDGDGIEDVIWEDSGVFAVSFMGASGISTSEFLFGTSYDISPWHAVAGGDFDGDGYGDLVFQRDGDPVYAMAFMNGVHATNANWLSNSSTVAPWQIIGGGDFDGDGLADLLLQYGTDSTYSIAFMNGVQSVSNAYVTVNTYTNTDFTPWQVRAVSDLDGDGHSDLVLLDPDTGEQFVAFMNGANIIAGDYLGGSPSNQIPQLIVGPR